MLNALKLLSRKIVTYPHLLVALFVSPSRSLYCKTNGNQSRIKNQQLLQQMENMHTRYIQHPKALHCERESKSLGGEEIFGVYVFVSGCHVPSKYSYQLNADKNLCEHHMKSPNIRRQMQLMERSNTAHTESYP